MDYSKNHNILQYLAKLTLNNKGRGQLNLKDNLIIYKKLKKCLTVEKEMKIWCISCNCNRLVIRYSYGTGAYTIKEYIRPSSTCLFCN